MPEPTIVQQQVQDVQAANDRFTPARVLPVFIDFTSHDPYELAQEVTYDNGIVKVTLEKGFKWDGASIPVSLPLIPWILTIILFLLWDSPWVLVATMVIALYVLRLLPYMQKMGRHSRGACVHDKLYEAQVVARVVADAIFESIMESDGVPWDVRWLIYNKVRQFGWWAWRQNRRALSAKAEAAKSVEVTK
jgi:hypothetical protein